MIELLFGFHFYLEALFLFLTVANWDYRITVLYICFRLAPSPWLYLLILLLHCYVQPRCISIACLTLTS